MEIPKKYRTLALILTGVALICIVYGLPLLINSAKPETCMINGSCQHEGFADQIAYVIPLALLFGIALGAAAHYLFSERISVPKPQHDKEAAYLLLDSDERKIVRKIGEQNGRALQSEISRIEGIGKVKAHRLLLRMSKKGIVEVESFGKTNTVKLAKGAKTLFE